MCEACQYICSRMTEMKKCGKCHKDKADDEFKEGRKTCTTCLAKAAEYQRNNPGKMCEKCKRHYEKEKDKIVPEKREKSKEKVWCDCCRTEARKDGWADHLASYKHKHYKELEEGDVMRQEGKCFSKNKRSKEHLRLLNLK